MHFQHSSEIWRDFPQLAAAVIVADGITANASASHRVDAFMDIARSRIATGSEGGLPEIQAWRRTFSTMGLKPTQYRCAAESLLRRLRKDEPLPRIHPLIDLCNAVSMAFAIPVAAFDVSKIAEYLEVRYAAGDESYEAFSGDVEHPDRGEVIFADDSRRAHARRWTNRQSGLSAVRDTTSAVLIVAEALHETAAADVARLASALTEELSTTWSVALSGVLLSESAPRFEF